MWPPIVVMAKGNPPTILRISYTMSSSFSFMNSRFLSIVLKRRSKLALVPRLSSGKSKKISAICLKYWICVVIIIPPWPTGFLGMYSESVRAFKSSTFSNTSNHRHSAISQHGGDKTCRSRTSCLQPFGGLVNAFPQVFVLAPAPSTLAFADMISNGRIGPCQLYIRLSFEPEYSFITLLIFVGVMKGRLCLANSSNPVDNAACWSPFGRLNMKLQRIVKQCQLRLPTNEREILDWSVMQYRRRQTPSWFLKRLVNLQRICHGSWQRLYYCGMVMLTRFSSKTWDLFFENSVMAFNRSSCTSQIISNWRPLVIPGVAEHGCQIVRVASPFWLFDTYNRSKVLQISSSTSSARLV